jgi:MtN3 and saliva related transmembrane protein
MYKIEIIGYIAGFLVAVALTPQVIKTWKTKSARDISVVWSIILMTGLSLWVVYAIVNRILPLAIFGVIEFSLALTLFVFKLVYRK